MRKKKPIKDSSTKKEYSVEDFGNVIAVDKDGKPIAAFRSNENTSHHQEGMIDAIGFIEKTYPETAKEFQRIQFEQWETFCKKQMDYGPSNISMGTSLITDDEKRLSLVGLIVRINDKVQRLLNLVVKNNRKAQNEPTEDAFKDLSVYGIIAQIVKNGKWGK
tara:strand:- start:944 stop:1429 length:486 start_codon:yes stop_codon:yes gene_type:complete